jgi:GntR family transcriptional regulator
MPSARPRSARLVAQSGIPLHVQAEARLRELIAEPRFATDGEFLTDEVSLASRWGISRNTLRQAIARLVTEGRLRRVPGQGTRVLAEPIRSEAGAWASFTREMRERGVVVKNFETVLKKATPPEDVAADLGMKPGEETWFLSRLRGWDGNPVILAESWLSPEIELTGDERFDKEPLYEVLQQVARVSPARSAETVRAVKAPKTVSESLRVRAGDPVLLRRRITFDAKRQPVEVNLNWCHGDRYALALELRANA